MKKFAQLSVVVALTVFAVACGGTEDNNNNNVKKQDETVEVDGDKKDQSDDKADDKANDKKNDSKDVIVLDEEDEDFDISDLFGDNNVVVTPNVVTVATAETEVEVVTLTKTPVTTATAETEEEVVTFTKTPVTTATAETEEEVVTFTKAPVTTATAETEEEVVTFTKAPVTTATAETEEEVVTVKPATPASTEQEVAANTLLNKWKAVNKGEEATLKPFADAVRSLDKDLAFNAGTSVRTIGSLQEIIEAVDGTGFNKCRALGAQYSKMTKGIKREFDTKGETEAYRAVQTKLNEFLKGQPMCVNSEGLLIDLGSDLTKTLMSWVKNGCKE